MLIILILHFLWFLCFCDSSCGSVKFTLNITKGLFSADGFLKEVYLVNGVFPGPEIRLKKYQKLDLKIINSLTDEPTTIHLHGFHMENSPQFDGVPGITQIPIAPGHVYEMEFKVTASPGTYWYHSHFNLQSSIFGPLIVEEDKLSVRPYFYDEERVLMLSDWYHQDDSILLENIQKPIPDWKWVGNPQSLLLNGKGKPPLPCENCTEPTEYQRIYVEYGKTYRFRIIGSSTLTYFRFEIPNHSLIVIEADGYYTQPYNVSYLEINSGQRYSVLLTANQEPNYYVINFQPRWRPGPVGYAVLHYVEFSSLVDVENNIGFPSYNMYTIQGEPNWILDNILPLKTYDFSPPPKRQPDRTILIVGKQELLSSQTLNRDGNNTWMTWTVNGHVYDHPSNVVLLDSFKAKNLGSAIQSLSSNLVFEVSQGSLIELVFQNVASIKGVCEQHPWHIHGYHFYDFGSYPGNYSDYKNQTFSYRNALFRDTITVYPHVSKGVNSSSMNNGDACGFHVVRLVTNNPGVWNLHCHITSHMHMGMQSLLVVY